MTRPTITWRTDHPPRGEKVIALTRYGVLTVGPVDAHNWDTAAIICWQHCLAKPYNWDDLVALRSIKTI
jgi:hypothetical protein